jgi:hypothetical protein
LRSLLQDVATAFPRARVELWAMDEHRIGLKPLVKKRWVMGACVLWRPSNTARLA